MNYKNFRQQVKKELEKIDSDSSVNLKEFSHFIKWALDKETSAHETAKEILKDALKRYDVFIRSWWIYDDNGQIIPGPGEKEYTHYGLTRAEAVKTCKEYNDNHEPGELSIKAEFEES